MSNKRAKNQITLLLPFGLMKEKSCRGKYLFKLRQELNYTFNFLCTTSLFFKCCLSKISFKGKWLLEGKRINVFVTL